MSSAFIDELRASLPPEYVLNDFLDQGGQGAVFSGELNGSPVALKLFTPQNDPGFHRLDREIPLLQEVRSPHVVEVIAQTDICVQGITTRVVAYELLTGGDLRQFLGPNSTHLSTERLISLGHDISLAVSELWARRIVHRDIKPANIMVRDAVSFVLVDVGYARHLDRSDLTAPGSAPGTPGYKSPEQSLGRRSLTIRSDVFSLGVTLYQMATMSHPFDAMQHNIDSPDFKPRFLRDLSPSTPDALARLIHQMLARRPALRPSSIHERFARFVQEGE